MTISPAYDLGCLHLELGHEQAALSAFQLALEFDPDCTPAQIEVARLRTASAQRTME
ncbi:MAG: hypothetical protein HC838_00965 [Spirulinaceae cyanobacterium RM2_2_10]|nr:hypothetical protein [Spirulinaceae cyanobacterium RM2_2_10]